MSWSEFTALLMLATAMSFTPGPNTTLSTALAANGGLARAMPFVCAVPLGWGMLLCACALGLGTWLQSEPAIQWIIRSLGCSYLLWLSCKLLATQGPQNAATHTGHIQTATPRALIPAGWPAGMTQGVLLQFINIKAWLLALTINSGWVLGHADAQQRLVVVLPVMMCYAFCSNLTYAIAGSTLREWLQTGKRLSWFNRSMAGVLALTAVWMFLTPMP